MLETLKGWDKLGSLVQTTVRNDTEVITQALVTERYSKLAIGEKLLEVRKILEPKRMFIAYMRSQIHMSQATGYRYIDAYQKAKKTLPKAVLDEAVKGNFKVNPKVVAKNPPPTTKDTKEIRTYLTELEKKPQLVQTDKTPDELLKECVNFISSRWSQVQGNHRTKAAFIRSLMGMLLTKFGVSHEQSFDPIAIPDNFRVLRGRPKAA